MMPNGVPKQAFAGRVGLAAGVLALVVLAGAGTALVVMTADPDPSVPLVEAAACEQPCVRIPAPLGLSYADSVLRWMPPASIPAGEALEWYTVAYRKSGEQTWGVYARGSTAQSKTVSLDECDESTWTCVLSGGDLEPGIYGFRVFARSSSGALGQMSTEVKVAFRDDA